MFSCGHYVKKACAEVGGTGVTEGQWVWLTAGTPPGIGRLAEFERSSSKLGVGLQRPNHPL